MCAGDSAGDLSTKGVRESVGDRIGERSRDNLSAESSSLSGGPSRCFGVRGSQLCVVCVPGCTVLVRGGEWRGGIMEGIVSVSISVSGGGGGGQSVGRCQSRATEWSGVWCVCVCMCV